MAFSETAQRVRKFVWDRMVETGRAPNIGQIGHELGLRKPDILRALQELDGPGFSVIMEKTSEGPTENIRLVPPFSNVTTPFEVEIDGERKWYAVCGVECLGVSKYYPGKTVAIHTYCRDCLDPITITMRDGQILSREPAGTVVHLGVAAGRWLRDIVFA